MNERDYPHIVEMPVPDSGFGNRLNAMHDWHRKRGIESRRGVSLRVELIEYVRWCFADAETAEAFATAHGGEFINVPRGQRT